MVDAFKRLGWDLGFARRAKWTQRIYLADARAFTEFHGQRPEELGQEAVRVWILAGLGRGTEPGCCHSPGAPGDGRTPDCCRELPSRCSGNAPPQNGGWSNGMRIANPGGLERCSTGPGTSAFRNPPSRRSGLNPLYFPFVQ